MCCQESAGATFNEPFYERLIRFLCLDDLRWCRWDQLITRTYNSLTVAHVTEPASFFSTQISQMFQRVLRHIPQNKASFNQVKVSRLLI